MYMLWERRFINFFVMVCCPPWFSGSHDPDLDKRVIQTSQQVRDELIAGIRQEQGRVSLVEEKEQNNREDSFKIVIMSSMVTPELDKRKGAKTLYKEAQKLLPAKMAVKSD